MLNERAIEGSVKIKKMYTDSIVPHYTNYYATGADLFAHLDTDEIIIEPHQTINIGTGVAIEIPVNYTTIVVARSGISCKRNLAPANKIGVIDCDYRGEIFVALHNHGESPQKVSKGERIAQMFFIETPRFLIEVVDELNETERDSNGFGSTGRF